MVKGCRRTRRLERLDRLDGIRSVRSQRLLIHAGPAVPSASRSLGTLARRREW